MAGQVSRGGTSKGLKSGNFAIGSPYALELLDLRTLAFHFVKLKRTEGIARRKGNFVLLIGADRMKLVAQEATFSWRFSSGNATLRGVPVSVCWRGTWMSQE